MANLTRWKRRVPKWEGNDLDPEPFAVEVRRLSVAERAAFRERLATLSSSGETLGAVLSDHVRGPIGALAFDGVPFEGDLRALVDGLAESDPTAFHALVDCLIGLVLEVNGAPGGQ